MSMYNRSFYERTKIQAEIFFESCLDTLSHSFENVRRPIFILIGIAVLLTIRSARRGVSLTKSFGYFPFHSKTPSYTQPYASTPYGTQRAASSYGTAGSYGTTAARSYSGTTAATGRTTGQYGTVGSYGGQQAVASQYASSGLRAGATAVGSTYGTTGIQQTQSAVTAAAASSVNTASLVDVHGASVQVVQGGLFRDYGAVTGFMGQVDTVSAMDSPTFVQSVVQTTPGQGKILVIDGGGSLSSAILDSSIVTLAQTNGWKGIIVNGAIRNADSVRNSQVGIKALGTHPVKGQQNQGQHGMTLSFGGVNISPGNWIYADKDGIVVSQVSLGVSGSTPVNTYGTQAQIQQPQQQQAANGIYNTGGTSYGANTGTSYGANTGTSYGANIGTGYGTNTASSYGTNQGGTYGGSSSLNQQQYRGQTSYGQGTTGVGGSDSYKSYTTPGTMGYNTHKSKRKTISLVLLACAVVWVCLGD